MQDQVAEEVKNEFEKLQDGSLDPELDDRPHAEKAHPSLANIANIEDENTNY